MPIVRAETREDLIELARAMYAALGEHDLAAARRLLTVLLERLESQPLGYRSKQ